MKKEHFYGSIDIGGTKIRLGLVDTKGRITARHMLLTPVKKTWQDILDIVVQSFSSVLHDNNVSYNSILGVGIGCPGTFDTKRETISFAPNLHWRNIPIKKFLSERFPVDVWLENDTNLSTLGVSAFGEGRGVSSMIGIFIGTGIGGGIILDKRLFIGSTGAAGEIGHMVVKLNGPKCSCGNRGCLESIASTSSIYAKIKRLYGRLYKKSEIYENFAANSNKSLAIKQAFESGEKAAVKTVHDAISTLGMGIVSLINLFNPQMVVLGGGLVETLGDVIIDRTIRVVKEFAMPGTCEEVQIIRTNLGDDAPIVGGAALIRQAIENKNVSTGNNITNKNR